MRIELELKTSESIFDPDKVLVKVKELEFLSEQSDFWSNQKKAQGTLKELSLLKKKLSTIDVLSKENDDLLELVEIYSDEDLDDENIGELNSSLLSLIENTKNFEIEIILSKKKMLIMQYCQSTQEQVVQRLKTGQICFAGCILDMLRLIILNVNF